MFVLKLIEGNIAGLEDINDDSVYSSTLKCLSTTGTLYCIPFEHFIEQTLWYSESMKQTLLDLIKSRKD